MRRQKTNRKYDRKKFKKSASKTASINHPRVIMRGGIRL